jgi:multidrug efflux system membrane fusion protein
MALPLRAVPCAVLALLLPAGAPLLADPGITVEAAYPGANARVVADTLAAPIEEQVNGLENLVRLFSRSTNEGKYTLHVTLRPGVDLDLAQVLVQNRVNLAMPVLPDAVKDLGVTIRKQSPGVLLFVTLFSPDASRDTVFLGNYTSLQVKDELSRLPGAAEVVLFGGPNDGPHVWLDPDKLSARNLSVADVLEALREHNIRGGGGDPGKAFDLRVSPPGRSGEAEALANVLLKMDTEGRQVRLKDVSRVELGPGPSHAFALLDGKPVVALGVFAAPQARPRDLSKAVQDEMERLKKAFPPGVDYSLAFDFPTNPGSLLVQPTLAAGTSPTGARERMVRCGALLQETEGVRHVLTLSENPFARFRDGPCAAALLAPGVAKQADRDRRARALRSRLGQVEGAEFRLRDLTGFPPAGPAVDFALRGPEAATVREWAEVLVERLSRTGHLTDLSAGAGAAVDSQLHVDVDRTVAKTLGVSVTDVVATLQTYLGSAPIAGGNRFGRIQQVQVRLDAPGRDRPEGIKRLKVRNREGQMVPLGVLVQVRETAGPRCIDRLDLLPAVEIHANLARGVSLAEARWLCETLAEEARKERGVPPEYRLAWLQEVSPARPIPAGAKPAADAPPPEVSVSRPVARQVTDYEDFTGRTQAVQSVDVRARVTGYLVQTPFKEGEEVKKGDLLFEIDPRPYQAQFDQAQTHIALDEASLKLAKATLERDRAVAASVPNSVSRQQLDQDRAAVEEASARVKASQAALEVYKLNLSFTRLHSPIDGQVGRALLTPGNLVIQDQTFLTTVVSLDPLYAYFDVDEATLLRIRRAVNEGKIKQPAEGKLQVYLGMQGEQGYPHQGTVNFVNNTVDPATGTISVRAVFANPRPPGGVRLLSPGMFVRIRLPVGVPRPALLVPEGAVGSDQGEKFLYVVNDQNKAVYRPVTVGAAQDGLRVIEKGLQPDDRVIVAGVRRVRPGTIVTPREVAAPARRPEGPP